MTDYTNMILEYSVKTMSFHNFLNKTIQIKEIEIFNERLYNFILIGDWRDKKFENQVIEILANTEYKPSWFQTEKIKLLLENVLESTDDMVFSSWSIRSKPKLLAFMNTVFLVWRDYLSLLRKKSVQPSIW